MPEPSRQPGAEHANYPANYHADPHGVSKAVAPHRQAGYDAVYEVIRATPGDAWRNALIWHAVEAYRAAAEPEHERLVRAKVVEELMTLAAECGDAITGPRATRRRALEAAARHILPPVTPEQLADAIADGTAVVMHCPALDEEITGGES